MGDFNAHHASWDPFKNEDAAGVVIEDWAMESRMVCLNDGSATRRDLANGARSAPDVTLVSDSLVGRASWSVMEDVGSDHLPILTTVWIGRQPTQETRRATKWSVRKVDWD